MSMNVTKKQLGRFSSVSVDDGISKCKVKSIEDAYVSIEFAGLGRQEMRLTFHEVALLRCALALVQHCGLPNDYEENL